MRSTTGVYAIGLDHVRALAALMVFMWHFAHPPFGPVPFGVMPRVFALSIFNEGHTGVALFMTLSGFIFSMLSFGKDLDIRQFYKNRFFRIFPLLFFWCLFFIAVHHEPPLAIALSLFTLLDIHVPAGGWSLIIEAQFYLIFPFIHPILERKYRESGLGGVLLYVAGFVAFALIVRSGTFLQTGSVQYISYWTIFGRIDEFLFGVLFFYVYKSYFATARTRVAVSVMLITVLVSLLFWHWFNRMGGWYNYAGTPSTAPVWVVLPTFEGLSYGLIIAAYLKISENFHGKVAKAVAYVGAMSYSIYLANTFVIPLLEKLHARTSFTGTNGFGEYFAWGLMIGFPLITAFATLTYTFIEKPFLARRKRYLKQQIPVQGASPEHV
jgi:peptidoglycan/LPS O-acetylase OafA/YrhL